MMLCQQEATLIRSKDLKAFDLFGDSGAKQYQFDGHC
jgi:hypothetical protein